jgi:hypothetical protein
MIDTDKFTSRTPLRPMSSFFTQVRKTDWPFLVRFLRRAIRSSVEAGSLSDAIVSSQPVHIWMGRESGNGSPLSAAGAADDAEGADGACYVPIRLVARTAVSRSNEPASSFVCFQFQPWQEPAPKIPSPASSAPGADDGKPAPASKRQRLIASMTSSLKRCGAKSRPSGHATAGASSEAAAALHWPSDAGEALPLPPRPPHSAGTSTSAPSDTVQSWSAPPGPVLPVLPAPALGRRGNEACNLSLIDEADVAGSAGDVDARASGDVAGSAGDVDARASGEVDARASGEVDARASGEVDARASGEVAVDTVDWEVMLPLEAQEAYDFLEGLIEEPNRASNSLID